MNKEEKESIVSLTRGDLNSILEGAVYFQLAQLYDKEQMSIPCKEREDTKDAIVKEFWQRIKNHQG